jgi:ATP-binding cassette subfamily C (CFTR/MRP) protein 1
LLAEESRDDFIWDYENENAVVVDHADFTWERTASREIEKATSPAAKKAEKATAKAAKKAEEANPEKGDGSDTTSTLTEAEPFKLHNMNFSVGRNELLAVIGTVGSGKSSLLAALA